MSNVAAILRQKGRAVTTARSTDTIQTIVGQLSSRRIGAIVIVGNDGKIIGIVSERDIVRGLADHGVDLLSKTVDSVMTRLVVTCTEATSIDGLMSVMTERRIRHVPVLSQDAMSGIVSIGDVVKHHIEDVEQEATALREYIAAK